MSEAKPGHWWSRQWSEQKPFAYPGYSYFVEPLEWYKSGEK